jgi:hypothetical protein
VKSRKLIFTALLAAGFACDLLGQGTILFANRLSSNIWARIYDSDVQPLSGSNYSAQLFAGPIGSRESQLAPVDVPVPFRTGVAAGAWQAREVTIPFLAPGDPAVLQVRVWDTRGGTLTTAAAAASAGGFFLKSTVFTSVPLGGGDPPAEPARIVGNPDPRNNLPSFDCTGDLPTTRVAGSPALIGTRLQIDFEVAVTSLDRRFELRKARSPQAAWFPDSAATLQTVATNRAYWKFRVSTTTDGKSEVFYRLSSK